MWRGGSYRAARVTGAPPAGVIVDAVHGLLGEHRVSHLGATHAASPDMDGGNDVDADAVDGLPRIVPLSCTPAEVVMEVDGLVRRWRVAHYAGPDGSWRHKVGSDTGAVTFTEADRFPLPGDAAVAGSLRAPLPGTVVALRVAVGEEVSAALELLVIEAMKIQHVVHADRAGRVSALPVKVGSTVEVGAVLAVLVDGGPDPGQRDRAADEAGPRPWPGA